MTMGGEQIPKFDCEQPAPRPCEAPVFVVNPWMDAFNQSLFEFKILFLLWWPAGFFQSDADFNLAHIVEYASIIISYGLFRRILMLIIVSIMDRPRVETFIVDDGILVEETWTWSRPRRRTTVLPANGAAVLRVDYVNEASYTENGSRSFFILYVDMPGRRTIPLMKSDRRSTAEHAREKLLAVLESQCGAPDAQLQASTGGGG